MERARSSDPASIAEPLPAVESPMPNGRGRVRLEDDAGDGEDVRGAADALDGLRRHGVVQREDHEGFAARLVTAASRQLGGDGADVHMADVDAGIAEDGADAADHAGTVEVLADEDVAGGGEVGDVLVHADDALLAPSDGGGEQVRGVRGAGGAVWGDFEGDEIGVLLVGGAAGLGDLQAPVAGEDGGVDEVDVG